VPLCHFHGSLVVAVSDPLDPRPLDRVRFFAQMPVIPVMAPREDIDRAIRNLYSPQVEFPYAQSNPKPWWQQDDADFPGENASKNELDASVARLLKKMIADAHASGVSDIHIDTSADGIELGVRFRRHGRMSEYLRVPRHLRSSVIRRIKAMSGMDGLPSVRAQEGRITLHANAGELQLNVIAVPTSDGTEHISMKLVAVANPLPLENLGLDESQLHVTKQLLSRAGGLIVVAGPSDSGKTTTGHALLSFLNVPGRKLWAAENVIETHLPRVSQVQVNEALGWDYAAALRAILRADPDVILVGNMRDRDTAALSLEAALRGCNVLGLVHGNGGADTLARLLELGVNAFSLSDAVSGVIAQRLARRLCGVCRVSRPLTPIETAELLAEYIDATPFEAAQVRAEWRERYGDTLLLHGARGCDACGGTGYGGRIGLFELLPVNGEVRQLIRQRRSNDEIAAAAKRAGMRTLRQDAIEKALAGHCELLEVRAATV
jgi:type II secretory ATPase GspE/PulE/Tfp pilus assembly ATPase PilB-like protein